MSNNDDFWGTAATVAGCLGLGALVVGAAILEAEMEDELTTKERRQRLEAEQAVREMKLRHQEAAIKFQSRLEQQDTQAVLGESVFRPAPYLAICSKIN